MVSPASLVAFKSFCMMLTKKSFTTFFSEIEANSAMVAWTSPNKPYLTLTSVAMCVKKLVHDQNPYEYEERTFPHIEHNVQVWENKHSILEFNHSIFSNSKKTDVFIGYIIASKRPTVLLLGEARARKELISTDLTSPRTKVSSTYFHMEEKFLNVNF